MMTSMIRFVLLVAGVVLIGMPGFARSKVQEVNFEEMSMKGTIRNPEGAFLVQKKGLKFLPLYQVSKDMDARIRASEPDEVLNTTSVRNPSNKQKRGGK